MRSSPHREVEGQGVSREDQRGGGAVSHGVYAYREITPRVVYLCDTNPAVRVGAIVREFLDRSGVRKRALWLAARAMAASASLLVKIVRGERRPTDRIAVASDIVGLTLAQERIERLDAELRAEIEAFDRLSPIVEGRLVAAGLDQDRARASRAPAAARQRAVCGPDAEMRAA